MKKYVIAITKTSYGFIEVEANSKEEALASAEAKNYDKKNIHWYNSDGSYGISFVSSDKI